MARLIKQASFGISIALDGNVGPSGPNAREDVGIVQYALSVLTGGGATATPAWHEQADVHGARPKADLR